MKLGDRNIIAAYLGDVNVFTNYYGVSFPLEPQNTILTRTGYMPWHKELPIQSKMKSCTITSDGIVKYLNPIDRTKYEDGTDRDMTLNTMVEIPEFWYKCITDDTTVYLNLYPNNPHIPEVEHVEKFYISAYEAADVNSVLKSINDGTSVPVVSISRATMQSRARANNADTMNWNMYTYKAHRILTILYLVEYACTNSQKAFNAELTAEGYHQGGLGNGVTTGQITVNGNNVWSFIPCGSTDEHGNFTGVTSVTVDSTDAEGTVTKRTFEVPTYRGIENPFGHVWKNTIDTFVHYNEQTQKNDVYLNTNLSTFGSTNINDYKYQCSTVTTEGYKKRLVYNAAFDLVPPIDETYGGSTTTYWCDYNWTNSSTADRIFLLGGNAGAGAPAGLLSVRSNYELGYAYATIGSRLTYIP